MPIAPEGLALLVCPETRAPLRPASAELLAELNARVARSELRAHDGELVSTPLTEGLVRLDGACLYRLDDAVTDLLVEHRIDLDRLGSATPQREHTP